MNHLIRAELMPPALARFYLRVLAIGTLRYARYLRKNTRGFRSERDRAERETFAGVVYANECRKYQRGPVPLTDHDFSIERYWRRVENPYCPGLLGHGVYVSLYKYHGAKQPLWQIEVQILPPDFERSQCCTVRNFLDRAEAIRYGQQWITVGEAVIEAQEEINNH